MDKTCLLITSFNRAAQLQNSLERLTRLSLPDHVLVVDDGSSDNTEETVFNFRNRLPIEYIYNHNPNWSICSFARNIGVKHTNAEIVITSEPEILFMTDVIPQMLQQHQNNPTQMITAGTLYHMGQYAVLHESMMNDPIGRMQLEAVNVSGNDPIPHNTQGYVKIVNWQATFVALYRKEWIEPVGYWDTEFPDIYGVDDIDICTRIRILCDVGQIIDPNIHVLHQYHSKPPVSAGNAVIVNMDYFHAKRLSVNGFEDKNNPNLIANKGKEIGVIIPRP